MSITIGDGVTSIGVLAFYGCKSLTSITLGKGVTSIEMFAFSECRYLSDVYNLSLLDLTKGSKDNGYVAYYAVNIHDQVPNE